ncbi:Glutaredoxin [Escovopsis weberi]|uniref:Glutaredoxin n=1 Tax=Escovopsis weberi TaxID=150374 RepID=A0A0M8MZG5_ESCWE|nr:Glutaredoxin [Escovopsis weberi]
MATKAVKLYIEQNKVVVFSKTWCPYCAQAKKTLGDFKIDFTAVELDNLKNEREMQDALLEVSGQRTVPNIYIGQKHIGGNSDLQALKSSGQLETLLKEVDAL